MCSGYARGQLRVYAAGSDAPKRHRVFVGCFNHSRNGEGRFSDESHRPRCADDSWDRRGTVGILMLPKMINRAPAFKRLLIFALGICDSILLAYR